MKKIVILAHPEDTLALATTAFLQNNGWQEHTCLIAAEELSLAKRWRHGVGDTSLPPDEVELANGLILSGETIGVVLNRLRHVPMPHFARSSEASSSYAIMEMHALWLSWLFSLPSPVMGRPGVEGKLANDHGLCTWMHLAQQAGLDVGSLWTSNNARRRPEGYWQMHEVALGPEFTLEPGNEASQLILGQRPGLCREPATSPPNLLFAVENNIINNSFGFDPHALARLMTLAACDFLEMACCQRQNGSWFIDRISSYPTTTNPQMIQAIAEQLIQHFRHYCANN